jgi:hypothetical protein
MIYPIAHGLPTPAHGHDCALFSIHRLLLLTQPQPLHIDLQRSGGWRSRIKAITCICNIRALLWIRLTSNIVRRVVSPYGGVLVTMSKVSYANIIVNTRRNTAKTRYRNPEVALYISTSPLSFHLVKITVNINIFRS